MKEPMKKLFSNRKTKITGIVGIFLMTITVTAVVMAMLLSNQIYTHTTVIQTDSQLSIVVVNDFSPVTLLGDTNTIDLEISRIDPDIILSEFYLWIELDTLSAWNTTTLGNVTIDLEMFNPVVGRYYHEAWTTLTLYGENLIWGFYADPSFANGGGYDSVDYSIHLAFDVNYPFVGEQIDMTISINSVPPS